MDCSGHLLSRLLYSGLCLTGILCVAPASVAEMPLMFSIDQLHSGVDRMGIELGASWSPMPLEQSDQGDESAVSFRTESSEDSGAGSGASTGESFPVFQESGPINLAVPVPVLAENWQQSICQPLAYAPDELAEIASQENAIIPPNILSVTSQSAAAIKAKNSVVPAVTDPLGSIHRKEGDDLGEPSNADFKTELEILESLWSIDFKLGMQETSEDSNRVRFGTVARYKTPGQSLKVDMDFERNQGESKQVVNQLRLGTLAFLRWKGKELEVDLKYERRQDEQENVTNRVLLDGTHEWFFNSTRWSHYLGGKIEYDQIQAFDSRFETNTGFAYSLLKNRFSHVKLKAGATVSREIGVEREDVGFAPDSLYGVSVNQQVTTAHKISTSVDYVPQWSDLREYEVKSEANLKVVLDEELDLQFQVGARNRYESSMPIESIEEGTEYTTSLMLVY